MRNVTCATTRYTLPMASFARSFTSSLSFWQMLAVLNALGPLPWQERDSAWYDCLAHARRDGVQLTLMSSGMNEAGQRVDAGNGDPYSLSIDCPDAEEQSWQDVLALELLPALQAHGIRPTEPFGD